MKKDLLTAIVIAVVASATFVGVTAMQSTYNTTNDGSTVIKLKGHLTVALKDEFGKIKDYREFDNIVVKNGQGLVGARFFGGNTTALTSATVSTANVIAIGNGTTAATNTQTILVTECSAAAGHVRQTGTVTTNEQGTGTPAIVTIQGTFGAGNCRNFSTATNPVSEAGLFDSTTLGGGNMFARQAFGAVNKGASDSLTVTWTITLS